MVFKRYMNGIKRITSNINVQTVHSNVKCCSSTNENKINSNQYKNNDYAAAGGNQKATNSINQIRDAAFYNNINKEKKVEL